MKIKSLLITMMIAASCAAPVQQERPEVAIENGVMTPEVLLALGRISDPQLSPDGSKILYGVAYQNIEENNSLRNLYICNPDGSGKVQLTNEKKSVSNARWSKDGKTIFFLQGGQLWKAPFKGDKLGKKVKLSDIPNGIGEFKIAPNEAQIIYTSTVKNTAVVQPKDTDPKLDKAQAYATEDLMYRHWDHWVTDVPRSYVAPLNGSKITPENSLDILGTEELFELPTEPFGGVEQLDWAPDSRHIAYSCRKKVGKQYAFSTNTSIYIYDVLTGATVAVTEKGGYDSDPVWSPDGTHLAWVSMARDGYEADQQRLFVADIDFGMGGEAGQNGEINVTNIRRLGEVFDHDVAGPVWHGDKIYFNALMGEAVQSIFRASLDGSIERLTPGDWWTDFFSPFAILDREDGSVEMLTSYYSLEFPVELVSVVAGPEPSRTQITTENKGILDRLSPIRE
ncbi:MAG: PD40 domain-containing protein, partial [Bacteroidales bacterium]|nr:PD40 domain-containing protein [Bacteroidales bacterium]